VAVAASCIIAATFGAYLAFGVFFKPLLTEFGWTRGLTSGAFSLSMVMGGLLGIVMGGLTDRLGPRRVLTLCGFFLGLGYLLMSRVNAAWQLYLFYGVIVGVGMSGILVPLLSTVARWFVRRRSMMTGIVVSGTGIGTLIGPPVANWLISTYTWRTSYMILGGAVLIIVVSAAQLLRRDPAQMGQLPYGESEGGERESKVRTEGFSLKQAAYTRQLWILSAMLFCFGFCLFSSIVHIVPHATDLGISAASAASILAIIGAGGIAGNVVLGTAADRIGNRQVILICFILMSSSLFWLVPATKVWMLCLFAAVLGFARGGMSASESPLVARLFGLSSHGLIYGVIGLGFTTGAAIGPFLTGSIFDVTGSYQTAFLICAGIGIVGLILTTLLTPITGEQ
jgi:MFS family permease